MLKVKLTQVPPVYLRDSMEAIAEPQPDQIEENEVISAANVKIDSYVATQAKQSTAGQIFRRNFCCGSTSDQDRKAKEIINLLSKLPPEDENVTIKKALDQPGIKKILQKKNPLIFQAIESNNLDLVEYFVDKGFNMDVRTKIKNDTAGESYLNKEPPLMRAVVNKNVEAVRILIKSGTTKVHASVDQHTNAYGSYGVDSKDRTTPFNYARSRGGDKPSKRLRDADYVEIYKTLKEKADAARK